MSITADLIRGHTDAIILAKLMDGDGYGYSINKSIKSETGGQYELKEATLYSVFRRLEGDGLIVSYWGDGDIGARRRYYSITEAGRRAYSSHIEEWNAACKIINRLIRCSSESGMGGNDEYYL